MADLLLKEDGDQLLQETGDGILLAPLAEVHGWEPTLPAEVQPTLRCPSLLGGAVFFVAIVAQAAYDPAAMDWAPTYPTLPERPAIHASVQRAFFRPETPMPEAPLLSWAPQYDNVLEQPYSLHTTIPQAAEEEVTQWYGRWPDVLFRESPHAPLAPFHFWSTFTPTAVVDVSTYAWRPAYPDRVERRDVHASQQDAFFRPETPLPAAPPLSWAPVYPERIYRHQPHPQGWYACGPELSAFYQWRPSYPDQIIRHRPDYSGWYAKPLNEPPDIARLGWRGRAPEWIERRVPHPQGWYVRPLREPDDIARLGWRGSQPDRHLIPWTGAHLWPSAFKSPLPMAAAPLLSWAPIYPDRALGPRGLDAALQRALQWVFTPAAQPVDTLGWRGVWPDQVWPRASILTAQQAAYFKSPLPMAAAPHLSWGPVYPDRALGPVSLLTAAQRAHFFHPFPFAVPVSQFGWHGVWPDQVFRRELTAAHVPSYFKSPLPMAAAPLLSWSPIWPQPVRPTQAALPWSAWVPIVQAVDAFGWRGLWPDLVPRRHGWETYPSVFAPAQSPSAQSVPPLSWSPAYPGWIAPPQALLTAQQPFYFKSPLPMAAAPLLSWAPSYPVWLPPVTLTAAHHPALFRDPLPQVIPLSWSPEYPSLLLPTPQASTVIVGSLLLPTPVDELEWRGVWPVYIPRLDVHAARVPAVFEPAGFQPAQAVPPLSWAPSFPDYIVADRQIRWEWFYYPGASVIFPPPSLILVGDVVLATELFEDVYLVQEADGTVTITTLVSNVTGASAKEK